jgi:hypothetical protein
VPRSRGAEARRCKELLRSLFLLCPSAPLLPARLCFSASANGHLCPQRISWQQSVARMSCIANAASQALSENR